MSVLAKKSSRAKISSLHFVLRLHHDLWVIQNLSQSGTKVNKVTLRERGSMVALHPRLPNIVKLPGDLNIHVYCGDPLALDFLRELRHPMDELLMTGLDIRSYISSTTTQATELQSIGSEDTFQPTKTELDLYVLWDCPIYSQNGTRTYRALDPWTCQHKIVKLYKSDAGSGLEKRFASVKAMTVLA